MKKKLITLFALVCVVFCAVCFSACGGGSKTVEVTGITLDVNEVTLTEGECVTLTATISPSHATDTTLTWTTGDPSVATVDDGTVYAVGAGMTTITVSTKNGKTAFCSVTVEEPFELPPNQFDVWFDARGGEFEDGSDRYKVTVNEGSKLTSVAVTRGSEFVFTGWYKDVTRTVLWDFDTDTVSDNMGLHAGWKYLNKYDTLIEALEAAIKAERGDDGLKVEILSVFINDDGELCFVEKDSIGVFSYNIGIGDSDEVVGNADLIAAIPNATLTQINAYNYKYTSDNDSFVADYMAVKYTDAVDATDGVIFSCVSEWEEDTEYIPGGEYYSCKIKAIIADADGKVFDCSFTVVSGFADFNAVLGGSALSNDYHQTTTELGAVANDFYVEYLKAQEA